MIFLVLYFAVSMVLVRVVRGRFKFAREIKGAVHGQMCEKSLKGVGARCDNYMGGCTTRADWQTVWILLTSFFAWPLFLMLAFIFANNLPKPNVALTRQAKLDRLIAQNERWERQHRKNMEDLGLPI